jgi:hypothetical protein
MMSKREKFNDSHTSSYSNCTNYSTATTSKSADKSQSALSYASTVDQFKQLTLRAKTSQTNAKKPNFKYFNEYFQPAVHHVARTKFMMPKKSFSLGKFMLMSNGERIRINENRLQDRYCCFFYSCSKPSFLFA